MTKEVLKLALEALEQVRDANIIGLTLTQDYYEAVTAIKAALEAKDELVQWKMGASGIGGTGVIVQPQRTWVGLTDEDEIDWEECGNLKDFVKAIEAKLKEKNT
jgi:hypothetical protein